MKAQFLKIAKVKTGKQFYAKYPTEAAFFKAHPDAKQHVKKARTGTDVNGNGIPDFMEGLAPVGQPSQGNFGPRDFNPGNIPAAPSMNQIASNAMQKTDSFAMPNQAQAFMQNTSGASQKMLDGATKGGFGSKAFGSGAPTSFATKAAPYVTAAMDVVKGVEGLNAQDQEVAGIKQQRKIFDLQKMAAGTRPEEIKRRYVRPEDVAIQPDQMFPTYGVGTNVLARDGARLYSGGEIQNTYAPDNLYDDLGYEPLNDSNIKQYYEGGYIRQAQGGAAIQSGGGVQNFVDKYGSTIGSIGGSLNNGSAEAKIGSGIGTAAGTAFFGPAGGMVGGALGGAIGGLFNTSQGAVKAEQKAIKKDKDTILGIGTGQAFQNQYSSVVRNGGNIPNYEKGGWVSHDWQPQVISSFGGLNEQEVYDYAHDGMDSLRAGGHISGDYQPISNRGMQQYAMGGEVKTTWGGHAETISHNPYMPGSGETIMFRGKSHDESDGNGHTGIGVKYGQGGHDDYTDYAEYGSQEADANVEVERGEPAAELQDASGEKNLTVYGNLKIPNQYVALLGDPKAKDKKFKNYVGVDLFNQENKGNKLVQEASEIANKKDATLLEINTAKVKKYAGEAILKTAAERKTNAAHLQNAINATAEEHGLVADDLAKGKVKFDKEALQEYAEYGKTIKKAKDGDKIKGDKMTVKEAIAKGYKLEADGKYHLRTKTEDIPEKETKVGEAMAEIPKGQKQSASGTWGKVTPETYQQFVKDNSSWFDFTNFDPKKKGDVEYFQRRFNEEAAKTGSTAKVFIDGDLGEQTVTARIKAAKQKDPSVATDKVADIYEEDKVFDVNAQKRNPWLDAAGQILPFFRPTDQEGLDPQQLSGEMYALSSNQLEPVQAQSYQPDLATPYDISYQDQLNANQADYNTTQKMVGYNPAAQATLNAQKYAANEKVLGEQFRANQAMQSGVYNQNRQTLNDAKLKNLDIFDRQYGRQEQAKSNTKAITQAALNSISDKYAKNKLENKELGIYENLYNYRYDPSGRAVNMNAPWQANLPNMYDKGSKTANMREVYDKQGNFLRYEPIEETKTATDETLDAAGRTTGIGDKKNGGKVKAKNGSIVSSYKNL